MCNEATECDGACESLFLWRDGPEIVKARKIRPIEFTPAHETMLRTGQLVAKGRRLTFDDPAWRGIWLGAGEEKAVFLIIDAQQRAFALELLDRHGYREGRLTEGHYFADAYLPHLVGQFANNDASTASLFGMRYSGYGRAREFIFGWTIADFQTPQYRDGGFCGRVSARVALSRVWLKRRNIEHRYSDAHDANVMVELLPVMNPEGKTHYGLPLPWRDAAGHLQWYLFRLTPIDVRPAASPKKHPPEPEPHHRVSKRF